MVVKDFKLGKYKGLDYKKTNIVVSEEEILSAIENVRMTYSDLVEKDDVIEDNNHVYMNFDGTYDGKSIPGGKGSNYHLKLGQGLFLPDFEKNLIGLNKGDTKTFHIVFPEDYDSEELKGKKVEFKVEILDIKKEVHPELNDEFAKKLQIESVNTVNDLKEHVKREISYKKVNEVTIDLINAIMKEILDNVEIDYDEDAVEESVNEMLNDIKKQVIDGGMEMDVYYAYHNIKGEPALREIFTEEVKTSYLEIKTLEEIAKIENITLSDEEYEEIKEAYFKQHKKTEEDIIDETEFRKSILFKKVVNYLVESNTK